MDRRRLVFILYILDNVNWRNNSSRTGRILGIENWDTRRKNTHNCQVAEYLTATTHLISILSVCLKCRHLLQRPSSRSSYDTPLGQIAWPG